jgi:hypothetical protein
MFTREKSFAPHPAHLHVNSRPRPLRGGMTRTVLEPGLLRRIGGLDNESTLGFLDDGMGYAPPTPTSELDDLD